MKLKAVKSKIQMTDCADIVCAGMYCSEPIITKDDKGELIDNYFMYSRSKDFTQIEVPEAMFGIYSERGEKAYITKDVSQKFEQRTYQETFEAADKIKSAFKRYEELYPLVRENAYLQISDENKKHVSDYLEALRIVSGNTLYSFYCKLYPSFFEWADKALN
ncbi:MAG: hypothetical protein NC409_10170 [Clostridium sp.]|nr:hypothetical protein [Clostridium sp.]